MKQLKFDVIIGNSKYVDITARHFASEYSKLLSEKQDNKKTNTNQFDKEIYIRKQK